MALFQDRTQNSHTKNLREYVNSTIFNSYYLERSLLEHYKKSFVPWQSVHFLKFLEDFVGWTLNQNEQFFTKIQPSESTTIDKYILPIMSFLNWDSYAYGSSSTTNRETSYQYGDASFKPDITYYSTKEDAEKVDKLKKDKEKQKLFVQGNHKVVLEAKKFGLLKPKANVRDDLKEDSTRDRTPEEQIVLYMDMLHSKYGILTDGGIWKFFHKEFRNKEKFFSFDIGKLCLLILREHKIKKFNLRCMVENNEQSEFVYLLAFFYNIFSEEALYGEIPIVPHLISYSKKYSTHLDDKMKDRFVMAMNWACNGLAKKVSDSGLRVEDHLDLIQRTAESHLFNIIFFRSLESRSILPYYDEDNEYRKFSISRTVDEIYANKFNPSKNFNEQLDLFSEYFHQRVEKETVKICDSLISLYKLVHKGYKEFKIKGFRKSLFNEEEWLFANRFKIDDKHMINVMFYLSLIPKEDGIDNEFQLIPFDFLTPREIGAIYESFLEFKLSIASESMFWNHEEKKWEQGKPHVQNYAISEMVQCGDLYFCPDNIERKMTGSYYTPDHIVKYIVRQTLEPIFKEKSPKEILEIKICDPSMGSGHFLTTALEFIRDSVIDSYNYSGKERPYTVDSINNIILNQCLYGCDINPSAVKLSKMSLWLATAQSESELEDLDDQLVLGDSLEISSINKKEFNWEKCFKDIFKNNQGFDAIIGNPPWGAGYSEKDLDMVKSINEDIIVRTVDSYMFFINKTLKLLSKQGRLGFIVPDVFLYQIDNWKLRKKTLENLTFEKIVKLGNIFEKVNRPSCVFIAKNLLPTKTCKLEYADLSMENKVDLSTWNGVSVSTLQFDILKNQEFKLIPTSSNANSRSLIDKIYSLNFHTLESFIDEDGIQRGASPDLKEAFIVDRKDITQYNLEKKFIKKTLTGGSQIKRFHIEWDDKYIIYTTKNSNKDELKNIFKYISKFRSQITCKEVEQGKHPFYVLHRSREEKIFKKKNKILGVITSDKIIVSIDDIGYYPTDGAYLFGVNENITPVVLTCILNSNLFIFLYQALSQEKGRPMAQVKPTTLANLPIAPITIEIEKKLNKEYAKLQAALNDNDLSIQSRIIESLNSIIYDIYNLNDVEIRIIENEIKSSKAIKLKVA